MSQLKARVEGTQICHSAHQIGSMLELCYFYINVILPVFKGDLEMKHEAFMNFKGRIECSCYSIHKDNQFTTIWQ